VLNKLNERWNNRIAWKMDSNPAPHEAHLLTLDSAKAQAILGWRPRWTLDQALEAVVDWWQAYESRKPLREVVTRQIDSYESAAMSEAS
jgi:CDP-glucose 4,6-dehydratase